MTAEEEEEQAPLETHSKQVVDTPTISAEITNIFEFLSFNETIVFKSQQIDDPELERSEKVQIAYDIFGRSVLLFLQRFGSYLEEHHLFSLWNLPDIGDEIEDMLLEFRKRLQTRNKDVKNRRYAAMQDLIKKGDYFSELEMMNRAPELYQELVGQYLSEEEIKQRDSYDVKNTTFSGILMHTLEQQQRDKMLKEADAVLEKEEELETEKPSETNENSNQLGESIVCVKNTEFVVEEDEESQCSLEKTPERRVVPSILDEYEVPISCRQQWGNFDDENVACSTSRLIKPNKQSKSKVNKSISKMLTAGERDLLRQEFVGLMQERFLSGKDSNFDYSLVDENTQLDDLSLLNQDKEDAYFDNSDDEAREQNNMITAEDSDSTDTEDDLDIYMRHLNQHHSLRI